MLKFFLPEKVRKTFVLNLFVVGISVHGRSEKQRVTVRAGVGHATRPAEGQKFDQQGWRLSEHSRYGTALHFFPCKMFTTFFWLILWFFHCSVLGKCRICDISSGPKDLHREEDLRCGQQSHRNIKYSRQWLFFIFSFFWTAYRTIHSAKGDSELECVLFNFLIFYHVYFMFEVFPPYFIVP